MIRAFIAVDIPADIRAAVHKSQECLKRTRLGVKVLWTNISNVHLTLQFLGNVEEPLVPKISQQRLLKNSVNSSSTESR